VPAVKSADIVALYDPVDGRVAHIHQSIILEGADRRSPEESERRAFDLAQRLGNNIDGLRALFVPDFRPGATAYRVDLEKHMLVELELPDSPTDEAAL
jgi:hypothetical protein